jgi:hypothetical protein
MKRISSGSLKVKRLESQNSKILGARNRLLFGGDRVAYHFIFLCFYLFAFVLLMSPLLQLPMYNEIYSRNTSCALN